MKLFLVVITVLLMGAGCGPSQSGQRESNIKPMVKTLASGNHVEYEDLGVLPGSHCKLYLMIHTRLDSTGGIQVKRRYITICEVSWQTATVTDYDIRIR